MTFGVAVTGLKNNCPFRFSDVIISIGAEIYWKKKLCAIRNCAMQSSQMTVNAQSPTYLVPINLLSR